jgi:phosphoribosylaminoimidazolecarboxamide formyltransferase/IMP cyclohydrolase
MMRRSPSGTGSSSTKTRRDWRAFGGKLQQTLRYGENPHQKAPSMPVRSGKRAGRAHRRQLQGKELSYNNINDTDAAFELVAEFDPKDGPAVAIIKHANPCGVATGATCWRPMTKALACDPVSAFGGIIAVNVPLDGPTAEQDHRDLHRSRHRARRRRGCGAFFAKKKNLRLLLTDGMPDPAKPGVMVRTVAGGLLVQDRDVGRIMAAPT